MPNGLKAKMIKLFNDYWDKGQLSKEWQEYMVCFIDKKGRQKVRPIAPSYLGKLLERIINTRLEWWAEKKGILDKNQNGFRKGRSLDLLEQTIDVRKGLYGKKKTIAVFLDIISAYDNVKGRILIKKLKEEGCPEEIVRYINEMMKEKDVRFLIGEEEYEDRTLNQRLPQGGMLSLILYAIYTKNIGKYIAREIEMLLFADDVYSVQCG